MCEACRDRRWVNFDGPCSGEQEIAGSTWRWRTSVIPVGRRREELSWGNGYDVDHVHDGRRWCGCALCHREVGQFSVIGGE